MSDTRKTHETLGELKTPEDAEAFMEKLRKMSRFIDGLTLVASKEVAKDSGDLAEGMYQSGKLDKDIKTLREALQFFKSALKLNPNNQEHQRRILELQLLIPHLLELKVAKKSEERNEIVNNFKKEIEELNPAELSFQHAEDLYKSGNLEKALIYYERALKEDPTNEKYQKRVKEVEALLAKE